MKLLKPLLYILSGAFLFPVLMLISGLITLGIVQLFNDTSISMNTQIGIVLGFAIVAGGIMGFITYKGHS